MPDTPDRRGDLTPPTRLSRAVWFPGPLAVEIREEPLPAVGTGEILVRAQCSAISAGTEMLVYRGQVPPGTTLDLPTLAGSFRFPIKYGYASVGTVEEVGGGVEGLEIGMRVFCLHPHQTRYVVPAVLAWPLPDGLPAERGVLAANMETALNVLLDAPVRLGERVAVFGQGVVGLLIGLLARRNGAGRVAAVDPFERRRALALHMGADATLDPAGLSPLQLGDALSEALGGRPDTVYEASGSPSALQGAVEAVAEEGTVMVCSWYGTKPVPLELGGRFHRGRIALRSTQVGRMAPNLVGRWSFERRRATVLELLTQLSVDQMISQRVRFEEAAQAYQLVAERPEETVQVVLTYGAKTSPPSPFSASERGSSPAS
jgi:2-desacetyl-2-hydroxyethyl bacteriochlorophyllide A dehydrogenase